MESKSRPAKLDLFHHSKDSFSRTFNVTSGGVAFDFTGYTLDCSIVPEFDSSNKISLTTTLSSGQIVISLTAAQVLTLGDEQEYKWYMKFTYPSGKIKTWFNGIYKQDFENDSDDETNSLTVSIGDQTVTVTISAVDTSVNWGFGNDAAMTATALLLAGASAGSYIFFNTQQNTPYFWNGSAFV